MSAFVGYAAARWAVYNEERIWRGYVADSLRLAPQMRYLDARWAEIMGWLKPEPERTADEIVDDVIARLNDGPA